MVNTKAEGTKKRRGTWREGSLGWKRPDALRIEWRQNGSDDTDVTRARCSLRRIRVNVGAESLTAIIIRARLITRNADRGRPFFHAFLLAFLPTPR